MKSVSVAPNGVKYILPRPKDDVAEVKAINDITMKQKKMGRKIVAVQGLGFVGAVMAAVIADATNKKKKPIYLSPYFLLAHILLYTRMQIQKLPVGSMPM